MSKGRQTYPPEYRPRLIEMLWRQVRREATPGELFPSIAALVDATKAFFARLNERSAIPLSVIGSHP